MVMNRKLYQAAKRRSAGQAIVEYIIIVAIVAIGALTVIGFFGDRIKELFSGATSELGSDKGQTSAGESSKDNLKNMSAEGENGN